MKIKENWKSVVGFEGLYEVSDLGRVRSLNYGGSGKVKELKPGLGKRGYLNVVLYKNGNAKNYSVHSLIYTSFKGPIPPGMEINHLNEDKRDNRLENLAVVTHKENCNHGTRNERAAKANSKELKMTNAKTCAKYTFPNSCEASTFFGYKNKTRIGSFISLARKRGENFIKIFGEKYYFAQQESERKTFSSVI